MGLGDDVLSRLILSDDAQVVFKGRREKGRMAKRKFIRMMFLMRVELLLVLYLTLSMSVLMDFDSLIV